MVMALYYFIRDGSRLKQKYLALSPLNKSYDEEIMIKVSNAITSVIWGSLIISVIQAVLAIAGTTTLAGFSNPVLLGIATGFANLVPGVGTMLVIVPAILYLLVTGSYMSALVLALWQICVVVLVDNIITPLLFKRGGIRVHQFFILLSILGGIALFGGIGFILGPILLAFFFALLDIYPLLIKNV
jgi:predicted PurR-regulated permease PerM